MADFDNTSNIIDSRSIIAEIDELEFELSNLRDDIQELEDERYELAEDESDQDRVSEIDSEIEDLEVEVSEIEDLLEPLLSVASQAEGYGDWAHGEALINDDYFVEYAEQLAEDIGAIDRHISWPLDHIDWEAAADALKMDYTSIDYEGNTFWMRS